MTVNEYILPLEELFSLNRNKEKSIAMSKYMRNKFEFLGIQAPLRKELTREFVNNSGKIPREILKGVVNLLWDNPFREYQYAAMDMINRLVKKPEEDIVDLYESMVVNKSWWDTVDYIAAILMGNYFKTYPQNIITKTNKWMNSGNIWLQRCCLLFQLKYKANTDTQLLEKFISELSVSKEFFIQKAIGWILREYSKTNPSYVVNFVDKTKLANLSKREALLWMKNKGML